MGLDQYIYSCTIDTRKQVDFIDYTHYEPIQRWEIGYWRNARGVQNWMKKLYFAKGGEDQSFNGNQVQLTLEDIVNFIRATASADYTDLYPETDLRWVPEAIACISEGKTVYYDSSW
jgi:hypothetical protein